MIHALMNHATCRYSIVLFLAMLGATSGAQSLRTVALTGLPADDGLGGTGEYGFFGTVTLNNDGHTAFLAQLVPEGGSAIGAVWSEGGGNGAKLVAADGYAAAGVAGGEYSDISATQPFINDSNQVLFRTRLATGVGGVTTGDNSGIWIADPGTVPTLVLREGDPVPSSAATFGEQTGVTDRSFALFNSAGQATVHHRLASAMSVNDFGIWVEAIGQPTTGLAREGFSAAGYTSETKYYSSLTASPTMNDSGTIAFYGSVTSIHGQPADGEAIWMGTPGNVQRILKAGDAAPGLVGATFADLETPSINNAGGYAFGGFTDTNATGVWASRTGGPLELLYHGNEAAFHPHGTDAIEYFNRIVLNSAGDVAFTSSTVELPQTNPPVVDQSTNASIWSDAGGAGLREVAREGDQALGIEAGVEYSGFSDPTLNALGQMAFIADLRGTGVTFANNQAIYAEDVNGDLHMIARKGGMLDVDDGPGVDERMITVLALWAGTGNEDGRRSGFNDVGQLAFSAGFGSSAGVFVSDLVASLGTPGDYNNDGVVNLADYTTWRDHLGAPAGTLMNDPSGEPIGAIQYATWKSNFSSNAASAGGFAIVPEPSGGLLLSALVCCGLLPRFKAIFGHR